MEHRGQKADPGFLPQRSWVPDVDSAREKRKVTRLETKARFNTGIRADIFLGSRDTRDLEKVSRWSQIGAIL